MSNQSETAEERRLRNLNAVYQHLRNEPDVAKTQDESRTRAAGRWKTRLKTWGPIGLTLLFILGKLKWLPALLKVLKLHSLASMVLAVWVYGLFFGLPFAVGFVLLIFVHELGHALVLRRLGIPAGAPVFIPFVGAFIAMKGSPRNAWREALVAIGGPALGTLGAAFCLAVAWASGEPLWYALAYAGFLINLFNMVPISPLDGGRIVGVVSRWLWAAGYAVGIAVFLLTYSPILFLILLLGLVRLWSLIRRPEDGYFEASFQQRAAMGAAYFGLMALMALGMWVADMPLQDIRLSAGQ